MARVLQPERSFRTRKRLALVLADLQVKSSLDFPIDHWYILELQLAIFLLLQQAAVFVGYISSMSDKVLNYEAVRFTPLIFIRCRGVHYGRQSLITAFYYTWFAFLDVRDTRSLYCLEIVAPAMAGVAGALPPAMT